MAIGLYEDLLDKQARPCYQQQSPYRESAGNRTTWKLLDHRIETQTAVVWSSLPLIRSGQNRVASQVKRGRRQGKQRKRWDLEFAKRERTGKMEESGCQIICGAPTTFAVKGKMMMMKWKEYQMRLFAALRTFILYITCVTDTAKLL